MNQSIYAVILNYNGHELTGKCLDSLASSLRPIEGIFVVDNGSRPEDVAALSDDVGRRQGVSLLKNDRNLGFAAGVNAGIREAMNAGASHILLVNNDATLDPGCLAAMIEAMDASPGAAAAGPCIYYAGESDRIWQAGGEFSRIRAGVAVPEKNRRVPGRNLPVRETGYLCGCVMLIGRTAFESVGYFDERFFMYCEDVDFCFRITKAGLKLLYVPAASAWHLIESAARDRTSEFVLYHLARSRLLLLRKHFSRAYLAYGLLLHLAAYTPFRLVQILTGSGSFRAAAAWLRGIKDGLSG